MDSLIDPKEILDAYRNSSNKFKYEKTIIRDGRPYFRVYIEGETRLGKTEYSITLYLGYMKYEAYAKDDFVYIRVPRVNHSNITDVMGILYLIEDCTVIPTNGKPPKFVVLIDNKGGSYVIAIR